MHAFVVFVILALMLICRRIYDSVEPFTDELGSTGATGDTGATGATGDTGNTGSEKQQQTNKPTQTKQSDSVKPVKTESITNSSLKYSSLATSQRPYAGINYFN